MLKLGSHVGMSGKKMMLGSGEEALSYGANTFMIYTGAPQNTRRKEISELNIDAAHALMKENGIDEFIIHAPYIINLANTVKPETYELAVHFLRLELTRADACRSNIMVLHPGAHVGAGVEAGIASVVKGLNEVLTDDTSCLVALETMAGKGTEIGRTFEEAIQKGLRMIGQGMHGFVENKELVISDIDKALREPTDKRIFVISKAFRAGYTIDQVHELTKIDKWFLQKLMNIMKTSEELHSWGNNHKQIADLPNELLRKAKVQGFSDFQIARAIGYEGDMEDGILYPQTP